MADDNDTGSVVGCLGTILILIVLAVVSPSAERLDSRLSSDGWIPVNITRINLLICNLNFIEGVTGARGFYFGGFGHYYGFEWYPN